MTTEKLHHDEKATADFLLEARDKLTAALVAWEEGQSASSVRYLVGEANVSINYAEARLRAHIGD